MKALMLSAIVTVLSGTVAVAQERTITNVGAGGRFVEVWMEAYGRPFEEKTGVRIVNVPAASAEQFARARAMAAVGDSSWDILVALPGNFVSEGDLLEKIDCARVPNAAKFGIEAACNEYGVLRNIGALSIVWNKSKYPDGIEDWAALFDVEKNPGRRCLAGVSPGWLMAAALMADGVKPEDMYPMDVDRALNKLREVKPHVSVWWKSGSQSGEAFRAGECDLGMMYSTQSIPLVRETDEWDFTWNQGVAITGYLAIAKNSVNKDLVYELFDFIMGASVEQHQLYSTTGDDSASKLATASLPPDEKKYHATAPENISRIFFEDPEGMALTPVPELQAALNGLLLE